MTGPKLLIDTNILIGLEDHKAIDNSFSEFQQKCQKFGVQLYVHEASKQDIGRDKDIKRRQVILSKIAKFLPLGGMPVPDRGQLQQIYGKVRNDNDYVDVLLLYALHEVDAVDFLITQDLGIHKRAHALNIADRVFRVEDAIVWLRDTYDRIKVSLPYIEEKECHQINRADDIFQSLRDDYAGFDAWFNRSCVRNHRHCWTINFNDEISGIAIRKDESPAEFFNDLPSAKGRVQSDIEKILKICTFKIKERHRGEKLGEQLIKQVLWWASKNSYDLVYLTVYPKHKYLIHVLTQYGFEAIGRSKGELYLAKAFRSGVLESSADENPLAYHRQYYPNFRRHEAVSKYLVPIKGPYYETLFPENVNKRQTELFDASSVGLVSRIPGNTIRKVYVCHAGIKSIREGDILLFFHLKDDNSFHSQALITVGITDGFDIVSHHDALLKLTAKRSVFSPEQLVEFTKNDTKSVKVINFLLAGHISPAIFYGRLQEIGIKGPYQSIRNISHEHFQELEKDILLDVKTS